MVLYLLIPQTFPYNYSQTHNLGVTMLCLFGIHSLENIAILFYDFENSKPLWNWLMRFWTQNCLWGTMMSFPENQTPSYLSPPPDPLSKIIEFTESLTAIWYRWWARSAFLSHRISQNEIAPQLQFVFNGACVVAVQPRLTHPVIHPPPLIINYP